VTRIAESPPQAGAADLDRILLSTATVEVGRFRVRPEDPRFRDSGPIQRHIAVFPRTPVWIAHEGGDPFVASPELVTYYNRGQVYRRESVRRLPDRCEWFAFAPSVISEVVSEFEPAVVERPDRPFPFPSGPGDSRSYLLQRGVVESLRHGPPPDPLEAEETMLRVFAHLVAAAYRAKGADVPNASPARAAVRRRDRDLAQNAKAELARGLGAPARLADVARRLGTSPFRLCRVFRRETGSTVHGYRTRLRLASALELLRQSRRSITEIALALGYSSHSHFTAAFAREYGLTPSEARRTVRTG
jgi:AraC family transcriptional regulator